MCAEATRYKKLKNDSLFLLQSVRAVCYGSAYASGEQRDALCIIRVGCPHVRRFVSESIFW